MEQNVESTQTDGATQEPEQREKLERAVSGGASWFYWIAGLSLVNSAIVLFGGQWNFIVGLGVTQIIDAIASVAAQELGSSASTIARAVAFTGDLMVAGVFVLFGVFANKRHAWAFIVGMVLYALDGMLFLLVGDWLSVGFHGFALFCIWAGSSANRKLTALTPVLAPQEATRPDPITP